MGFLKDGAWHADEPQFAGEDGSFKRKPTTFRDWVTADGAPGPTGRGGFRAESGRYHLYVSLACPWAHRTLILRSLKGLTDHVSVSVVHPLMRDDGWTFDTDFPGATGDGLFGLPYLRDVYVRADPKASGRVTVPVLWDRETGGIVSNESADILRMFNSAFREIVEPGEDYWPEDLRAAIEPVNARIYDGLNNGVYRAGFATSQAAYDGAAGEVFDTLDWLEERLRTRRWLMGDAPTEADWRLLPTLFRFDPVYHGHFKCNRRRIVDYPAIWAYARAGFQHPGIAETVNFEHIKQHYYASHQSLNPSGVVPLGPELDWNTPVDR